MATEKDNPFNKGVPSGFSSYKSIHDHADTDETSKAIHHTLGKGATQAAPGKDTDDRLTSLLERLDAYDALNIQHGTFVVTVGTTTVTTTVNFNKPYVNPPRVFCTVVDTAPVASANLVERWGSNTSDSSGGGNLDSFIYKVSRAAGSSSSPMRVNWWALTI